VAADLFQAHRRTDVRRTEMIKPIVAFRNFSPEYKNYKLYLVRYSKMHTFSSNTKTVGRKKIVDF